MIEVDTSSSSDSDIEMELRDVSLLIGIRRPKVYKNNENPLQFYSDYEFRAKYRFNMRGLPLCVEDQLLITFRYYATNSFQNVIGVLAGVGTSTICSTVKKVNQVIASKFHDFVKMPSVGEQQTTAHKFFQMNGIPRVLGLIDGTHIPIVSPGGANAELFRNRKGWFSINCQVVCDADFKIIDLTARWHGSAHDQTIFNFSLLKIKLENEDFGNKFLLGDSGYANKNYLLTPLRNTSTVKEKLFNTKHKSTRNLVERCIGIWKRRFSSVATKRRLHINITLKMIVATAVLHNIAMTKNEPSPSDPEIEVPNIYVEPMPTIRNARESFPDDTVRKHIINNL